MVKVSIIVPVYNVEKYLANCLESIIRQDFNDFEIIIVDDGSTDRSSVICDEFHKREPRCRVIHQENKGLSGARNTGMMCAKGEYICFLDSDDSIVSNMVRGVCEVIEKHNVDVVGYNALVIEDKKKSILSTGTKSYRSQQWLECSKNRVPLSMVPLYCYRRKFLLENDLWFKEGVFYEDILFTAEVFFKNPKIYFCGEIYYYYNKRDGSITTSKVKKKNYDDMVSICCDLMDDFSISDSEVLKNARKNVYKTYIMLSEEVYMQLERNIRKSERKIREKMLQKGKQNRSYLGIKYYFLTCFPRIFYILRNVRRRWRLRGGYCI